MDQTQLIFYHPYTQVPAVTALGQQTLLAPTTTASVSYIPDNSLGSSLNINIKPNQLSWNYGLNTVSFPTYAGEVTQVLSAYIDNLTIGGDISTYSDMELIYKWFIAYMTAATQGQTGKPTISNVTAYIETPVTLTYPHRGWQFSIRPLSLPAMTYGTDVVVPSWSMQAAIAEANEKNPITQMMNANLNTLATSSLNQLDASFGAGLENPFNYWSGSYNQADINKYLHGNAPILNSTTGSSQIAGFFQNLVKAYSEGDTNLDAATTLYSKPYQPVDISAQVVTPGVTGGSTNSPITGSLPNPGNITPSTPANVNSQGYVNPFSSPPVAERIDMGVDYGVSGGSITIYAIGNATLVYGASASSIGWPGTWYMAYTLTDGPQQGKTIYVSENINPIVTQNGTPLKAGQPIATMTGGIEIGWSNPINVGFGPYAPIAHPVWNSTTDSASNYTAAGKNFSDFLVGLGAPAGLIEGAGPLGTYP